MAIKVKRETKFIMLALERFLMREDIKEKQVTQVLPKDKSLGELAGKKVNAPLWSLIAGFFKKIPKERIAEILDNYNFIVKPFLEELYVVLHDYHTSQAVLPSDEEESLKKVVSKKSKGDKNDKY